MEKCPPFNEDSWMDVIIWAQKNKEATIGADDEFVGGDNVVIRIPSMRSYYLSWSYGSMQLYPDDGTSLSKDRALMISAMFIYLYELGVEVRLAIELASFYTEIINKEV